MEDNINEIKNIHDNRLIIYAFLELNDFYQQQSVNYFIKYSNLKYLVISILLYSCDIDVNTKLPLRVIRYKCTLEEFYAKMKELLDIDSHNKPIFE